MSDPSVAGIYFDASDDAVTRANMLMACFPFDAIVADVDRDHHLWDEPQQRALEQICNLVHSIQTPQGLSKKPFFITNAVAAETADGEWRPIQAVHATVSKDSNFGEASYYGIWLSRCFQGAPVTFPFPIKHFPDLAFTVTQDSRGADVLETFVARLKEGVEIDRKAAIAAAAAASGKRVVQTTPQIHALARS